MEKIFALLFIAILTGCVSTAPISVAWRSNSSLQTATTDGQTTNTSNDPAVNADKTTETQAAVTTSSGDAKTQEKSGEKEPVAEDNKENTVETGEADADAVEEEK